LLPFVDQASDALWPSVQHPHRRLVELLMLYEYHEVPLQHWATTFDLAFC